MNPIVADNGFKSRKLWFSVFSTAVIAAGGWAGAKWPQFAPLYDTMVGGIVGIAGIYLTGSVATKLVGAGVAKAAAKAQENPVGARLPD